MHKMLPVLTVLGLILVVWYAGSVAMNLQWTLDQAARQGVDLSFSDIVADTQAQRRPMLPPPHQVASAMWEGLATEPVTSKRSLVYHAWVTVESTLAGFVLGIALGVLMAVGIVYFRECMGGESQQDV